MGDRAASTCPARGAARRPEAPGHTPTRAARCTADAGPRFFRRQATGVPGLQRTATPL